jgi:serine/threonine protein phosphatase PrpC
MGVDLTTVQWGAATSAGRVRTLNEDNFLAQPPLFVVADGMGGHAAGEVASAIVVDELGRLAQAGVVQAAEVASAVERANDRIVHGAESDASRAGMGTTVTGLGLVDAGGVEHWLVFNVGDSRVYRFAGGELVQLSVDHSQVEELVSAREITRGEARVHPLRNVVTRSLGSVPAPVMDQWLLPPLAGDRFLVCSDGLVAELEDPTISEWLAALESPQELADHLVALAVQAGGRDNITVLVVDVIDAADEGVSDDTTPRRSLEGSP